MTRKLRLAFASVLSIAALGAVAPAANAYIYWANATADTISRANLDGTGVNQSFISGAEYPAGIAVDGEYIYWANNDTDSIGRAKLDGTDVNQSFITGLFGPYGVGGVEVDGGYIYWANSFTSAIGRATLNGANPPSDINQGFITGSSVQTNDVTVDGGYIYWANYSPNTGSIGRATLDGSGAANGIDQEFITNAGQPTSVRVDDGYIYWNSSTGNVINRATLNGSGAVTDLRPSFIATGPNPLGIAIAANSIFSSSWDSGTIGRANLDGTGIPDQSFFTGASNPFRMAVDSLPIPTISGVGKATKTSLKVKVGCGDASACSIRLTGKKVGTRAAVTPKTVAVGAGRQPTVTLAYTKALKSALAKGGRISVTASSPANGGATSITVRVAR